MSKMPAFQFYPADWRKDPSVQALTYEERGIWFEMLCIMHESEQRGKLMLNGKAMSEKLLARILHLDNQKLTTTLTSLLEVGCASRDEVTKSIQCRRMVRDEEIRQKRKECGRMGGNPALLGHLDNQKSTKGLTKGSTKSQPKSSFNANQKSTPSSSSSATASSISQSRLSPTKGRMSKPTLEECQVEAVAKGMPKEEGFKFWHFYESKGWLVGKGPMKVWRSSMATWANNFHREQTNGRTASGASKVHALRVQIQNLKEESSQIKESAPEIGGYRQVKSLPEEKRTRLGKLQELIRAKENQMATEQI